jgi:hypothetical protein
MALGGSLWVVRGLWTVDKNYFFIPIKSTTK